MPYAREHSARIKHPSSVRSEGRKTLAEGVDAIMGALKSSPDAPLTVQSLRFNAAKFTQAQARG